MKKYKKIILLILCSLVYLQPIKKQNVMHPTLVDHEKEDVNIDDPKLKEELAKLRNNFKKQIDVMHAQYNEDIKPLQLKRDQNVNDLKKKYLAARKSLLEEINNKDKKPLKKKGQKSKIKNKSRRV